MRLGGKGQDIPIQWVANPLGLTEIEEVVLVLLGEVVASGVGTVHMVLLVLVLLVEVTALRAEAVHLVLLEHLELDCGGGERLERSIN